MKSFTFFVFIVLYCYADSLFRTDLVIWEAVFSSTE